MLDLVLIGLGAGGNKAAIEAIESGIIDINKVKLINTTLKDIPDKFKNNSSSVIKFSSMMGGCGKEPIKGQRAMFEAIKNKAIDFSTFINAETKAVILVTSIEGGTGCGATPVVAKYFTALNIPVHIFALVGFQDEVRGINNSLRFFKELPDGIILHTICNNKFLDFTKNYTKAEQAANKEFAKQLKVLIGCDLVPSVQNIDDTDHYKLITTSGYMDIRHVELVGAKNLELVNQAIINSFESMSCLEYESGCKRLAVIINATKKIQDIIDSRFDVIKRYTGEPLELFRHVQEIVSQDQESYIDVIVAGLQYPEDCIKRLGKRYNALKDMIVDDTKVLSDIFEDIDVDSIEETNIFKMKNPNDILATFDINSPIIRATRVTNVIDENY